MAGTPKIQLQGITKAFAGERVLTGVDLTVGAGQSLVLVGRSGAGKTLLLKIILGLVKPDAGQVLVDGVDVGDLSGDARTQFIGRFGMLFQWGGLFDSLPVWENVAFRLVWEMGMPRPRARDLAVTKLAAVGLEADVADLYPNELSGGMQKRVGIARAIAADPEILLLDEPTAGLDPIMSNVINDLLIGLVRGLGATAISIDSDMAGARRIADDIAMLYDGRMIWQGPAAATDACDNAYVDQFIHSRADGPIQSGIGGA